MAKIVAIDGRLAAYNKAVAFEPSREALQSISWGSIYPTYD